MWKFNDEKIIFVKLTAFLNYQILDYFTYSILADSAYFVKSTAPRAFTVSF